MTFGSSFCKTITVSTYFHVCSGETRGSRTTCFFFLTTWHNWALQQRRKYHLEAADEVAPRKRLTSLLKLALDLMAGIWAGSEFHNWAVDGRNGFEWPTRFDLGTSTARSWDLTDCRNLGSWTWMSGISWHNSSGA